MTQPEAEARYPYFFGGFGGFAPTYDESNMVRLDEYQGQAYIQLACTQLVGSNEPGFGYPGLTEMACSLKEQEKKQKQIIDEWIAFFKTNPKALTGVLFRTGITQKVLEAVCHQENLEILRIKWGTQLDLSVLQNVPKLKALYFDGFRSPLPNVSFLDCLQNLSVLNLYSINNIEDFSPLYRMKNLEELSISGKASTKGKRIIFKDVEFLQNCPNLKMFGFGYAEIKRLYTASELEVLRQKLPHLHTSCDFFARTIAMASKGKHIIL
ncbi:MAG: hypothetical protein FWB88_07300 [Defluviitaleaceae bacterium]|nr:hypothetical protein [Defluviitaleaceae bacterium]MCL2239291.1 hypothetical protein [Defluviitaleaceae bacterium]